ncbi:DoxX family protein [Natronobiforma cellulositropha]|uniref:DoxX family protein n=1 Tax=Natronobiforma cellulositropha TaxID=1679076 RepID=UPI0021D58874|nr:DoxX family protein [Natronobiforma cellulositropha]
MAFETAATGELFLIGRIAFAAILGYLAIGNLLDLEGTVAYAESKGAPLASISVPVSSLLLLGGVVSILVGAYPLFGALAIAAFLVGITPVMHDFWNAEGMDKQNEQIHFLKNVGLAGVALVFAALAGIEWPYALGVGM